MLPVSPHQTHPPTAISRDHEIYLTRALLSGRYMGRALRKLLGEAPFVNSAMSNARSTMCSTVLRRDVTAAAEGRA